MITQRDYQLKVEGEKYNDNEFYNKNYKEFMPRMQKSN